MVKFRILYIRYNEKEKTSLLKKTEKNDFLLRTINDLFKSIPLFALLFSIKMDGSFFLV